MALTPGSRVKLRKTLDFAGEIRFSVGRLGFVKALVFMKVWWKRRDAVVEGDSLQV